ncbi:hypothetical protein ALP64_202141 [Pseudomonas syringae pv. actinidiae]|nr:hypothetical protein ALP64_202141 [Pseudomonas syringae pv. actinidiae]
MECVDVLRSTVIARHQRYASLFHQRFGCGLAAHRVDGRGGRAEKNQPGSFDSAGKVSVFRQKTVTGVDRLCAADLGCFDELVDHQVAFSRLAAAKVDADIGLATVARVAVNGAVYGNGGQAHLFCGAHDAAGNFPAVGDQQCGQFRPVHRCESFCRSSRAAGSSSRCCQPGARFCRKARKPS